MYIYSSIMHVYFCVYDFQGSAPPWYFLSVLDWNNLAHVRTHYFWIEFRLRCGCAYRVSHASRCVRPDEKHPPPRHPLFPCDADSRDEEHVSRLRCSPGNARTPHAYPLLTSFARKFPRSDVVTLGFLGDCFCWRGSYENLLLNLACIFFSISILKH